MREEFVYDQRLGIHIPELLVEWSHYPISAQEQIVYEWEQIRGRIPERIIQLEMIINKKQEALNREDHFPSACRLNTEIAECASIINDLHLWYRANQEIHSRVHQ